MISDTQDGTFLVRDSSQKGSYTIAVKTGDIIINFRIIFSNHKYGLSESTTFNSVAALVAHYRAVPTRIGITLAHPFSKLQNVCLCFSIYLCSERYVLKYLYAYFQLLQFMWMYLLLSLFVISIVFCFFCLSPQAWFEVLYFTAFFLSLLVYFSINYQQIIFFFAYH